MPALQAHPASASHAARLRVDVTWRWAGDLLLEYRILGDTAELRMPLAAASPGRHDGLWRHSCGELFVAEPGQPGYREFNFSPSGHWAAYDFDGYRSGMRPHEWVGRPPRCVLDHDDDGAILLRVALSRAALPVASRLTLGPTVVLEALDGGFSFWALRHAAERPDFHHSDVRDATLEVPA